MLYLYPEVLTAVRDGDPPAAGHDAPVIPPGDVGIGGTLPNIHRRDNHNY